MNVEIGAEAALFPEKEYKNGIAVAVWIFMCLYAGKKYRVIKPSTNLIKILKIMRSRLLMFSHFLVSYKPLWSFDLLRKSNTLQKR
jgi:hypothetical protein